MKYFLNFNLNQKNKVVAHDEIKADDHEEEKEGTNLESLEELENTYNIIDDKQTDLHNHHIKTIEISKNVHYHPQTNSINNANNEQYFQNSQGNNPKIELTKPTKANTNNNDNSNVGNIINPFTKKDSNQIITKKDANTNITPTKTIEKNKIEPTKTIEKNKVEPNKTIETNKIELNKIDNNTPNTNNNTNKQNNIIIDNYIKKPSEVLNKRESEKDLKSIITPRTKESTTSTTSSNNSSKKVVTIPIKSKEIIDMKKATSSTNTAKVNINQLQTKTSNTKINTNSIATKDSNINTKEIGKAINSGNISPRTGGVLGGFKLSTQTNKISPPKEVKEVASIKLTNKLMSSNKSPTLSSRKTDDNTKTDKKQI